MIAKHPKTAACALVALLLVAALAVGCTFTGAEKETEPVQPTEEAESEIIPLTEEEIADFNAAFEPMLYDEQGNPGVNPLSHFFTSCYDRPEDINLSDLLRYFSPSEDVTDEAEFEALKAAENWPFGDIALADMPVPIHRYSADTISETLKKYAGITLDELSGAGADELIYLKEYDAYYNFTSDAGFGSFVCTSGERQGDTVRLYGETATLTLIMQDGGFLFVSHQRMKEEAASFSPDTLRMGQLLSSEYYSPITDPETVSRVYSMYETLVIGEETDNADSGWALMIQFEDSATGEIVSWALSPEGACRFGEDALAKDIPWYEAEGGDLLYTEILSIFNNQLETQPGSVAEGVDAPDAVLEKAKDTTEKYFSMNVTDFPDYEYSDWRITSLEWVYAYDDIDGMAMDVYRMNYEFLSEAPENIMLAGGMYITDDGWVCPWSPNCTYLVFDAADSGTFLFSAFNNDSSPGEDNFTEDLRQRLEELMFPDSDLGLTPTEGILEQAVKYPYDLDFRGYITDFSETSVSVDEIVWDTESDDYPDGYAIINDDTSVTEYPLAENCEFWILKDYWYPCQRLDYETYAGFLATDQAFTEQYDADTLWVFA